jgi:hypothetical protein
MSTIDVRDLRHLFKLRVPMRDGITLAADVHLPGPAHTGPWPTILIRTPYSKQNLYYSDPARYLAVRGYAVVVQDVRGRFDSEGDFYPFFNNEGPDGFDTLEWVADQPWCTGRIGMMGGSYGGWVQWCAAAEGPPNLVTFVSASAATRWMQQVPFHNGVPTLIHLPWLLGLASKVGQELGMTDWEQVYHHLPLRTMDERAAGRPLPVWREWLARPDFDDWWHERRLQPEDFAAVTQPVLHITSHYDGTQPGELEVWRGSLEHSPSPEHHMIFGCWEHEGAASSFQKRNPAGFDYGPEAVIDINAIHAEWFDSWLRDEDEAAAYVHPRIRIFFTGPNRWHSDEAWPPKGTELELFLGSDGSANASSGDGCLSREPGEDAVDTYAYDPNKPTGEFADLAPWRQMSPLLPIEASVLRPYVEERDDVLVYTSEPLDDDLAVAGEPRMELHGGSDAPDTDWHVYIADVWPDGTSQALVRGEMGARYRNSLQHAELMEPDEVYRFEFELLSLAHVFRRGHRVRLVVTSSNFPTYCRNQNVAEPFGESEEVRVANNRVHHGTTHPSCVVLPVVALGPRDESLPTIPGGRSALQVMGLEPPFEPNGSEPT